MRYILDDYGYIEEVTFGAYIECRNKSCTEYIGEVPNGYNNLEEWSEKANIRAYKIIDNNLVYDENKDKELQVKYEVEAEENETATHKWVRNQLGKNSSLVIDEFSYTASGNSIVLIEDSGEYEIPSLQVFSEDIDKCNVLVSNKNLLGIDAVTQTINGVEITINEDKTITLNGTATDNIELTLKGTSNNLDMLFLLVKENNYVSSGLNENTSLNLYNFDGTDRTLIGTFQNEVINLSDTYKVTQTSLNILSGSTFEDITINPQIEINDVATTYIKHEENKVEAKNKVTVYDLYSYYPVSVIMADEEVDIVLKYFKSKTLQEEFSKIETTSQQINFTISTMTGEFNSLKSEVAKNLEDSEESINGILDTLENGVNAVKNALVTIDVNGISVATNVSKIATLITNNTFAITSSGTNLAYFGYDETKGKSIAEMDNLTIRNYLVAGYHRTEKFEINSEKRTGVFFIGDET